MQNMPEHERPISEKYRLAAEAWVDAYCAANIKDSLKSETFAKMVRDLIDSSPDHMPVNRAEMTVRSDPEWIAYKQDLADLENESARLKVQMQYWSMRFEEWRTLSANSRQERRMG